MFTQLKDESGKSIIVHFDVTTFKDTPKELLVRGINESFLPHLKNSFKASCLLFEMLNILKISDVEHLASNNLD